MDKLLKDKMINSLSIVPEGWGHSIVGGNEIWTRPSNYVAANSIKNEQQNPSSPADEDKLNTVSEPDMDMLISKYTNADSNGFVGNYHESDLASQYKMLTDKDKLSEDELDELVMRKFSNEKKSKEDKEADDFISSAIMYGRLKKVR